MENVMRGVRRFTRWGYWFGGALSLLAVVVIAVDILMRKFLSVTIGGADQFAGYVMAISMAWAVGGALIDRAHIRIDSLYVLFPRKARLVLDVAAAVLFLAFFAMVAWRGYGVVQQSWQSGTRSQTALSVPVSVPQTIWLLGLLCSVIMGVLMLAYAVWRGLKGDIGAMQRTLSTRSAEEEVEEEIRDIEMRRGREEQG